VITHPRGFSLVGLGNPGSDLNAQAAQEIADLQQALQVAQDEITALNLAHTAPDPPPPIPALPTIKVAKPDEFDDTPGNVEKFLHQCNLFLATNLYNDKQKVVFGLSYMKKGNALPWAECKMEYLTSIHFLGYSWAQFQIDVHDSFGDTDRAATAHMKIEDIKQRTTVNEYIVWFKEYAALTGYNDAAKIDCLKSGLNSRILTKIYSSIPMPTTYKEWKE
jgi:Retrotransposon gag protein